MDLQLGGQVVVVVGGGRGIGAAIAAAFASEDAQIAVLDLAPEVEEKADEMQRRHGVRALGIQMDATDYQAMQSAAASVKNALGAPDHIVYAVGAGSGKFGFPFWNLDPADWDRVLRINLLGAVNTAHAFAPALAERGEGTLLFLASVAGQIGSQTDPPYSAAKAGLINFAQCAARDLAPFGVRVNTICPGMVKTDLNRSVWQAWNSRPPETERLDYEAWGSDKVRRVAPLRRWQEPEEIGAMAVYLASTHARNITGQTLNIDGGQVMHA